MRKWAYDMETYYGNHSNMRYVMLVKAHADKLRAEADIIDGCSGKIADVAEMHYNYPLIGKVVIRGGKMVALERPYNCEGEAHGIYTAWEWRNDPTAEICAGQLCRLYIGTIDDGPLAMYDADSQQWYKLASKGNYGKNYACGGTWASTKAVQIPEIVTKLEDIMYKLAQAKKRLEASKLRVLAAHQMDNAIAYERQSYNPAYEGQSEICAGKAEIMRAYAKRTLAQADLVEMV